LDLHLAFDEFDGCPIIKRIGWDFSQRMANNIQDKAGDAPRTGRRDRQVMQWEFLLRCAVSHEADDILEFAISQK
jgi:hypothetical protein